MAAIRKPYQGVWNIVRFNWHFYVLAIMALVTLFLLNKLLSKEVGFIIMLFSCTVVITIIVSLGSSFYVYDLSGFYRLNWMNVLKPLDKGIVVNINAGFDETSELLSNKFPNAELIVFDFYNPEKHTEVSIKRARKAYAPYAGTQTISTTSIPLLENSVDKIFLILAAHEIRDNEERKMFFNNLRLSIKPGGEIIVAEHLRDGTNFLAYNIGFFHFLSKKRWLETFGNSGLQVKEIIKVNLFITTFVLYKDGNQS